MKLKFLFTALLFVPPVHGWIVFSEIWIIPDLLWIHALLILCIVLLVFLEGVITRYLKSFFLERLFNGLFYAFLANLIFALLCFNASVKEAQGFQHWYLIGFALVPVIGLVLGESFLKEKGSLQH